jgi:hypothetical protein
MNRVTGIAIFILLALCVSYGQSITPNFLSEEFNFVAEFPEEPIKGSVEIETRFGSATGHRWAAESPEMTYEVSVTDFSTPRVEMNYKSLNSFYKVVCEDLIGVSGCSGYGHLLFTEEGMGYEYSRNGDVLFVRVFLIRQRMYIAKVSGRVSLENRPESKKKARRFLDTFLFVYMNPKTGKYDFGLPTSISQNIEPR